MQTPTVKAPHRLSDYMPALAHALRKHIGVADGQTESVTFVADFIKNLAVAEKADPNMPRIFPADMKKMAREMRVLRLLANPVEVDGHVISLRTIPSAHMYAKTKQIVIRRGRLDLSAYPPPVRASARRPYETYADAVQREARETRDRAPREAVVVEEPAPVPRDAPTREQFRNLKDYCAWLERRIGAVERGIVLDGPPVLLRESDVLVAGPTAFASDPASAKPPAPPRHLLPGPGVIEPPPAALVSSGAMAKLPFCEFNAGALADAVGAAWDAPADLRAAYAPVRHRVDALDALVDAAAAHCAFQRGEHMLLRPGAEHGAGSEGAKQLARVLYLRMIYVQQDMIRAFQMCGVPTRNPPVTEPLTLEDVLPPEPSEYPEEHAE